MFNKEQLFIKDLEGYTEICRFKTPLGFCHAYYGNAEYLANVHLDDGEVTMIFDRANRKIVYKDKRTRIGEKAAGITLDSMIDEIINTIEKQLNGVGSV